MKIVARITALASLLFFASCALSAIPSQYNATEPDSGKIDMATLGNGRVLIYNGADALHTIDNTARLNIWISDTPMGQIRAREYVVVNLPEGKYEFTALHIDMVKMKSKHPVEVTQSTKVIRIEPTFASNKLTVTNELPSNFDKFGYMKIRK